LKKISLLLLFIFSFPILAHDYGKCIHDPVAKNLQVKWQHYFKLNQKRAYINSMVLVEKIKMDPETMKLLQAISEVEHLTSLVDKVEIKYFKKAFVDTRFNEMIAHPDFLAKLERKEVDAEIKASDLKFRDDPAFYLLLDQFRAEISKPEVKAALELFRNYDLGILEWKFRQSAKMALRFIRKRGGNSEDVRSWVKDPPYLRNVPYPGVQLGPFAIRYRLLVTKSVAKFVQSRVITLADAKKANPRYKQSEVDEMNTITPPTDTNSYDDHIATLIPPPGYKYTKAQFNAIDGVLRTLWGEATSCQSQGLP
jgi:hypothetical protein